MKKNKWWWATLLVVSAVAIVAFGLWSLTRGTSTDQSLSSISIRLVIIAGLVIIEEFARRNYNVASRLAEAYGYKEAVAKSYVGFKKELADIELPPDKENRIMKAASTLAETFLQKIGDEPGKKVFDKDRPALGVLQALSRIGSGEESASLDPVKIVANALTFLSKVSWPIVALSSIVAVTVCTIVWILAR